MLVDGISASLSFPEPTTSLSPIPTTTTSPDGGQNPDSTSSLKRWEIAVIAVNISVVVGLLVIVPLAMICVCTTVRKRNQEQKASGSGGRGRGKGEMVASYKRRATPKSMFEHIQLEESNVETVDFGELELKPL